MVAGGGARRNLGGMDAVHHGSDSRTLLAVVRAVGRLHARRWAAMGKSYEVLARAMREARLSGASVTDIASAAGVSRKAVYNALRDRPPVT